MISLFTSIVFWTAIFSLGPFSLFSAHVVGYKATRINIDLNQNVKENSLLSDHEFIDELIGNAADVYHSGLSGMLYLFENRRDESCSTSAFQLPEDTMTTWFVLIDLLRDCERRLPLMAKHFQDLGASGVFVMASTCTCDVPDDVWKSNLCSAMGPCNEVTLNRANSVSFPELVIPLITISRYRSALIQDCVYGSSKSLNNSVRGKCTNSMPTISISWEFQKRQVPEVQLLFSAFEKVNPFKTREFIDVIYPEIRDIFDGFEFFPQVLDGSHITRPFEDPLNCIENPTHSICLRSCIGNGQYCHSTLDGINGSDIIMENLRQVCALQSLNSTKDKSKWFEYLLYVHENCIDDNLSENCSSLGHEATSLDYKETKTCVQFTQNTESGVFNALEPFKHTVAYFNKEGITRVPSVIVNGLPVPYGFFWNNLFAVMCSSFSENSKQKPDFCIDQCYATFPNYMHVFVTCVNLGEQVPLIIALAAVVIVFSVTLFVWFTISKNPSRIEPIQHKNEEI